MGILVLSSHSNPRLSAPINHQAYAARHGYGYLFDATPYPLAGKYDQKLHAIVGALDRAADGDFVAWVDDDVYFMQLDRPLDDFLPPRVLSVCHSPVNPAGGWSRINSGVMLIRAGEQARLLFRAALVTSFEDVRAWWEEDVHGSVCVDGGDQERILFQIDRLDLDDEVSWFPAEEFNARVYHFTDAPDQHFVCHAASHTWKPEVLTLMRDRFPSLDQYLLPEGTSTAGSGMFESETGVVGSWPRPQLPLRARVLRRIIRRRRQR